MVDPAIIINKYPRQKYITIFNQRSGFMIRKEDEIGLEPFWCSYGPELIDISISNWCDKGCFYCYKDSKPSGLLMDLSDFRMILQQAAEMKVLQIAIGGGNPNQHPEFCEMLQISREQYNIVPSYTTNGRGLHKKVLLASHIYCGAVAVSAHAPYEDAFLAIQMLLENDIRTNLHFLLTSETINTAIKWLECPPHLFERLNAIIFLNYKPIGRKPEQELLIIKSQYISTFFELVKKTFPFKIGFDSCLISGVADHLNVSPLFVERCEAGRFSMYISEDMRMYPCSFMVHKYEGVPITKNNIQTVWRNHISFVRMRELLQHHNCQGCKALEVCFGGCPIYPEINICSRQKFYSE